MAGEDLALQEENIRKLNEQVVQYKQDIQRLYDENKRTVRSLGDEINKRETEIERLRVRDRELEGKILAIENLGKDEKNKLGQRVLELESFLAKEQEAKAKIEESSKNALAASTGALLEERAKVTTLQARVAELSRMLEKFETEKEKILQHWEKERKKWEELWERERRVWENQRAGFFDWEARYMKEKTQWEKLLGDKEEKEIRLTRVFSSLVNELNRWATAFREGSGARGRAEPPSPQPSPPGGERGPLPMETGGPAPMPPHFPQLDPGLPPDLAAQMTPAEPRRFEPVEEMPKAPSGPVSRSSKSWLKIIAKFMLLPAMLGLIVYGSFYAYRGFMTSRGPVFFQETESWDIPLETPSGVAEQTGVIWVADWKSGEIIKLSQDDPAQLSGRYSSPLTFFHPNSIVFSPDGRQLFSLDSVSRKIYRHKAADPKVIEEEAPSPTASCLFLAALAPSGKPDSPWHLAVLDTIGRQIHVFDPKAMKNKPSVLLTLPQDIVPLAFAARGEAIWVLDGKTFSLLPFARDAEGAWRRGRAVQPLLGAGVETLAGATAILARDDGSFYIVLESDPPRLVLTTKKMKD
ncbi:MAG: hypothetical protein HYT79_12350 [Elusimicrobia bacterium]|nr:hypothetical protein [Elusimicrobiota bacterium]